MRQSSWKPAVRLAPVTSRLISLYVEAIALHTRAILLNHALAVPLWIIAVGEEHALVPRSFLILANATWLPIRISGKKSASNLQNKYPRMPKKNGGGTLTFAADSPAGLSSVAMLDTEACEAREMSVDW